MASDNETWFEDPAVQWMMDDIGVDWTQKNGTIQQYIDSVAKIESDARPDAANSSTSAKGMFQWLNGERPDGKKGLNVFKEDLKAAQLYYKKAGVKEPEWIRKGLNTNDPTKLDKSAQEKLFLFRMYRLGKNADLKRAYEGDRTAQRTLYFTKHHTAPDEATIRRVNAMLPAEKEKAAKTFKGAM